ncbi:MAG: pyruvate kinase [Xanthomonadales bacterium]|nr:pyruvate kinase [Xanthomonadales bacterium]
MTERRRTKIIATLGPATDKPGMLVSLFERGLDVVRVNLSHGTAEHHRQRVKDARAAAAACGREVAVLADLRGPKIRIESFDDGPVSLEQGDPFVLYSRPDAPVGTHEGVGVTYHQLVNDVKAGDTLLLDDGLIAMMVEDIRGSDIHCRVTVAGVLHNRKGLNLQGGGLSVPGLAEHDIPDITLAAEMDVDYLAVSFPSSADDMHNARRLLREAGGHAALVSKIERAEAIDHLEAIIDASDAVLVARGDLGVEIGDAQLPGLQKRIIETSTRLNRVVITATQMMQSMVDSPIPTRAEVLDVANAVIDGSDAVMLSAETAVGRHPHKVVEAMNRICLGAERHCFDQNIENQLNVRFERIDQAIAMATMYTANRVAVDAIVAMTESGSTAQWLSRVRSHVPIFALTPNTNSRRRMALYRDVYPVAFECHESNGDIAVMQALKHLLQLEFIQPGQRVLMTMGDKMRVEGGTNTMRLVQISETGEFETQMAL